MRPTVVIVSGSSGEPSPGARIAAFLVRWLVTAAAVWVAASLVGGIHLEGFGSTLAVALILGLLNAYLKPLLIISAFPGIILTLGFLLILINTALLGLTAWIAGKIDGINFRIDGFWSAFFGAIIISIVSFILTRLINPGRIARRLS
ncbi:phage holin family protein [Tepidiforma sp.]|uniref:phage holin family protein n=1 Tax=Tepidiforma sp. TaxID=2682230 RepID=UPI002ADE0288|nr:phage holin family protein [Tepidiforma sp.]